MRLRAVLLIACALVACRRSFEHKTLSPAANPFTSSDPLWSPQPHRDHPWRVALSADGRKLYVTLQGIEDDPGHEVAVVDTASNKVLRRIAVGSGPSGLRLHPGGRFLVVTNRFSNFASVIDTTSDEVVLDVQVPFYTVDLAFTPDGRKAFLANRWKDALLRWDVSAGEAFEVTGDSYSQLPEQAPMGLPVAQNPRDLAMSPDGKRLYVASPTSLEVSVVDPQEEREIARWNLHSPPGGIAATDRFVVVSHTGRGTQHPPDSGPDGDEDSQPGDGTANVMFQDLQNELSVFDLDGRLVDAHTSDSICCHDFRDVDPDRPERGLLLGPPDTWPPSRVAFLPPKDRWTVAGSLPESIAIAYGRVFVVFSASNEVQTYRLDDQGKLAPEQHAGGLFRTGMNPAGLALTADGTRAYVAERLGEGVTVLDFARGPGAETHVVVGDLSRGPFPATDAEIGEAINFMTAGFSVDGDQSCVHCHRDGGNIAKAVAMPLQKSPVWGARMVMAYRGLADTRPWFMESAMDETNFFPVINEFARRENFCCEELDPLVWSRYPSADACRVEPSREGCQQVLDCPHHPPPECAARPYGGTSLTRNEHFLAAARALLGRDHTFGDVLHREVSGKREGLPLDFSGVTRSLGLFLLQRPRFLPNPNPPDAAAALRGRAIYESPEVGCASCHPLPLTTVTLDFNPYGVPSRQGPVVTPRRDPLGTDADVLTAGFLQSFPTAEQTPSGVRFGVPQLRGVWDRAERFFHDGRAHSLREALATPGHPALQPGERGFDEIDGMPDTHGATSRLTPGELEDLIAFLQTL